MSADTSLFLASKLFWAIARPDSALLLTTSLGALALAVGFRRTGRVLLAGGVLALLSLSAFPVADPLLLSLERRHRPHPPLDKARVAGIVLLGGASDVAPSMFWNAPNHGAAGDRIMATAALARRLPRARVIVTGGGAPWTDGARAGSPDAETLMALGVPAARIVDETSSRNTAENAALSRMIARQVETGSRRRWVLVTSAFHMPRALATFCSAGWTDLVPWPVDHRSGGGTAFRLDWDPAGRLAALNTATKEWVGFLAYRLFRWIDLASMDGCVVSDPPDPDARGRALDRALPEAGAIFRSRRE